MKFSHVSDFTKRKKGDALVIPFWKDEEGAYAAVPLDKQLSYLLGPLLVLNDFKAKEGELLYTYSNEILEPRIILLGLGSQEKVSAEMLRRSYGSLTKSCLTKKIKKLNVLIPETAPLDEEKLLRGIVEGLLIPNSIFKGYKHRDPEEPEETLVEQVTWIGPYPQILHLSKKTAAICEGVYYTRRLVNGNADLVTPQYLGQCAKELAKKHPAIKTTVFDKKRIEKEKLGLLLAVNRGSALDPAFIIMEYHGNPRSKDRTVLVGKGVTYDTGGLFLKPSTPGSMDTMKCDMAGAAVCFGTILAITLLKLKVNLTIVVPSTENCIDAKSYKPGDVYPSYSGKTVEMTNSDAEGRLILADALSYAIQKLHPTRLIDIATLTGAIDIAIGAEAAGLMCLHDDLKKALIESGEATYERLWRMPLFDEYVERLKSDIADLKNWNGRPGGACVAATFLRQFVDDTIPWAHLDIASTAYISEGKKYNPKYATGFGVRLLLDFLENLAQTSSTIQKGVARRSPIA